MKGTMKLVNPITGRMVCSVCGNFHHGQVSPGTGGKLSPKNWQCRFGCSNPKDRIKPVQLNSN